MTQDSSTTPRLLTAVVFVVVIVFLLWLAVKLVAFLPGAFGSLASIADGINNYRPTTELNITSNNSVVNSGSAFTIRWDEPRQDGEYTLLVNCIDGVTVSVRHGADVSDITCDEPLTLRNDSASIDITALSESRRFVDLSYELTFTPETGDDVTESDVITIVNASIPTGGTTVADTANATDETDTPSGDVAGETISTSETPSEPTTPQYQTVETPIYAIPQSDPQGDIDLSVSYIGVGTVENGVFTKAGSLATDEEGAIRFVVKNLGTKTSDEWYFDAELPSDIDYTSEMQAPLKPNEEAFLTVRFTGLGRPGVELSTVTVKSTDEISTDNNSFNWAITVTD